MTGAEATCITGFRARHTRKFKQARHVPLHPLQPWQARLLCRDSDYFSVFSYMCSVYLVTEEVLV